MDLPADSERAKIEEFRQKEMEARQYSLSIVGVFFRGTWERNAEGYKGLADRLERKSSASH